jgi:hypothetical protein
MCRYPASFHSSSSLSSFTLEAERAMYERNRALGNPVSSVESQEPSRWGSWSATEVSNFPMRDDHPSGSHHSSGWGPSSVDLMNMRTPMASPIPLQTPIPSLPPSQQWSFPPYAWEGTPIQQRPSPRPTSRASSIGPVRRRRGSIVPEEDLLETYPPINTGVGNFRFGGKTYLLTYSQIGDMPNSALQEKMEGFGNHLKSE